VSKVIDFRVRFGATLAWRDPDDEIDGAVHVGVTVNVTLCSTVF
jgi:hypothetical protein